MAAAPWDLSDELWSRIEPLLPKVERRFRYPGRKRLPDRQILFVLYTGSRGGICRPSSASVAALGVIVGWMSGSGPGYGSGCTRSASSASGGCRRL